MLIIKIHQTHLILFLFKHFSNVVFSIGNIRGTEKLFLQLLVCGNDAVTKRLLPPSLGAWIY